MITFTKELKGDTRHVGKPVSRVDGRAKVTGAATYAAEFHEVGMKYGYVVSSIIARGRITHIDASDTLASPGTIQVFSHQHRPNLAWFDRSYKDGVAPAGSPMRMLHDAEVHYSGQPVALIVADTFEHARRAADLLHISYEEDPHQTNLQGNMARAKEPMAWEGGRKPPPPDKGDAAAALLESPFHIDAEYSAPAEYHNPMEMHGTTVIYDPRTDTITVYDKTQGVQNVHAYLTKVFGLSKKDVKVISPFVGGAFGSGLRPTHATFLAVMAALELKTSVRVTLTRQQMFSGGHRPQTIQRVAMGADAQGKLKSLLHEVYAETSQYEDYVETVSNWSGLLYPSETYHFQHSLVHLDVPTPQDMRAPGAAWGLYAAECAMDELAAATNIDPLQMRLTNYAHTDPLEDKPFGSKELHLCYVTAAEKFGWDKRNPQPRSMRDADGKTLIGYGMATGAWDAMQMYASAKAVLTDDGRLTVSSATSDIGTGTYTIMTQIAAESLGMELDAVTFKLGDSTLPPAPVQGGSWTAVTVGSAVKSACDKLARQLFKLAVRYDPEGFADAKFDEVEFADSTIRLRDAHRTYIPLTDLLKQSGHDKVEAKVTALPSPKRMKYAHYAHSAVFAEVRVDEDFGTVVVSRVVSSVAAGRVLNPKTARSQILGGIVWGIGMALHEEALTDHRYGRVMNHNLAEYHIPVNADIDKIDIILVDEDDPHVNALGAKGMGEIGIVGVAAAISNAVYHATGRRVRSLPITLDKLI